MNKDNIPSEVPEAFLEKDFSDDPLDQIDFSFITGYNECLKQTKALELRNALIEAKDTLTMASLTDKTGACGEMADKINDLLKSEKEGSGE